MRRRANARLLLHCAGPNIDRCNLDFYLYAHNCQRRPAGRPAVSGIAQRSQSRGAGQSGAVFSAPRQLTARLIQFDSDRPGGQGGGASWVGVAGCGQLALQRRAPGRFEARQLQTSAGAVAGGMAGLHGGSREVGAGGAPEAAGGNDKSRRATRQLFAPSAPSCESHGFGRQRRSLIFAADLADRLHTARRCAGRPSR